MWHEPPLFCARCQVPPYPQEIIFSFSFQHTFCASPIIKATILWRHIGLLPLISFIDTFDLDSPGDIIILYYSNHSIYGAFTIECIIFVCWAVLTWCASWRPPRRSYRTYYTYNRTPSDKHFKRHKVKNTRKRKSGPGSSRSSLETNDLRPNSTGTPFKHFKQQKSGRKWFFKK
jgi:hypothetical protein